MPQRNDVTKAKFSRQDILNFRTSSAKAVGINKVRTQQTGHNTDMYVYAKD
jgi:hypothetical protein